MAQTAATKTSEFAGFLQPHVAENYFKEAAKQSAVQSLARKVPLGINGEAIPHTTSKPKAGWVSEGGRKPTSNGGIGLRTIKPEKMAVISVVSAEVVRANPGGYMDDIRNDITEAFALAFDAAALHGTNTPFGAYLDQTTKAVEIGSTAQASGGVYGDVNAALSLLVNDRKKANGWALDTTMEPILNGAVDLNGRPLFVDAVYEDTSLQAGRLLNRKAVYTDGVSFDPITETDVAGGVKGYLGDWSKVVWGAVGGISYDVSTQATVTLDGQLVSLWENNLVAVRAEAEYGLLIDNVENFVKVTDNPAEVGA